VAAAPDNAEAYFYLGQSQLNRGDTEKAILSFEKATTLAPANSEYFRLLGDSYGITAGKAGLFSKFGWPKNARPPTTNPSSSTPRTSTPGGV